MTATPVIEIAELSKWFGANMALDGARFELLPGEVHALVGVNGAGKSTMMKIIAGVHSRDSGSFRLRGEEVSFENPHDAERHGISIVYQELSVLDDLTVAENIFIRHLPGRGWVGPIDRKRSRIVASDSIKQLGVPMDPDAMVGSLPVGEKQLIEIAKALSVSASIVIFDEPTSALTDRETHALFAAIRQLKKDGVGVIYISHHLDEIFRIADRLTVLRDGRTVGTRPTSEMDIAGVVQMMLGEANAIPSRESCVRSDAPFLVADRVRTESLRGPVTLELHAGEIVALAGPLGSGRTELLRALYGADRVLEGSVSSEGGMFRDGTRERVRAGIGFVPEERKVEGIITESSVKDNIVVASIDQVSRYGYVLRRRERDRARESITRVGVVPMNVYPRIESLSGGNQQKAIVGRWIARRGLRALLLDEPTRGIDVGAKTQIYRLLDELARDGMAILFASSDEEEILGLSDRVLVMSNGTVVKSVETSLLDVHSLTTLIVGGEI